MYCKEDISKITIKNLSDRFCVNGINSDIDLYYSSNNVLDWNHWTVKRVEQCCDNDGYILLLCGKSLSELLQSEENAKLEMYTGFIGILSL